METEAAHVTRMQNRRRMIILIILGAISQRGIKRTPDEAAINIAQQLAPIKIGTFLRKHKAKVNKEIRKQIMKLPTSHDGDSRQKKKESLWGCMFSFSSASRNKGGTMSKEIVSRKY